MNFGVIYIFLLMLFMFFGVILKKSNLGVYLFIGDIFIALPAYFVHPVTGVYFDTIRFESILDQIRNMNSLSGAFGGLSWSLNYSVYSNQPLVATYLWLFSFFKNNGMLFFITTLLFLLFLSSMLLKMRNYLQIENIHVIVSQFVILLTFNLFYQIEGIRNFLSFIILAWALFNDFESNKYSDKMISFILYIVCIMIHPITIPFIVFRLILILRNKFIPLNNRIIDYVVCFVLMTYSYFNYIFITLLEKFSYISFVDSILTKMQSYVYGQSNFQTFSNRSEVVFMTLVFLSVIIELIIFLIFKDSDILPYDYFNFYFYVISFAIGSFLSVQIYLRTIFLILFLSSPIKLIILSGKNIKGKNIYIKLLYELFIYCVAISLFVLWYMLYYKNVLIF